jgi:hypothetical protein
MLHALHLMHDSILVSQLPYIPTINTITLFVCGIIDEKVFMADGIVPTVLLTRKDDVDRMNADQLARLTGDVVTHRSNDVGDTSHITVGYLFIHLLLRACVSNGLCCMYVCFHRIHVQHAKSFN